ncbi:MAG: riboflavin synthase [Proteobacteria bacterium]|nr:riboflavin synthase [Pseudomonadota bacterium]
MFTGIITDIGTIESVSGSNAKGKRFRIRTRFDVKKIAMGASISCSGACMTVVAKNKGWFEVDVSPESLSCTHLGDWKKGTKLNLERALKAGDELGGHIVSGHVDGVGKLRSIEKVKDNRVMKFKAPKALLPFIAAKGSITIDGVSLTVNKAKKDSFTVNIIPHTLKETTLGSLREGDKVNLEIDMLARYTLRLLASKR